MNSLKKFITTFTTLAVTISSLVCMPASAFAAETSDSECQQISLIDLNALAQSGLKKENIVTPITTAPVVTTSTTKNTTTAKTTSVSSTSTVKSTPSVTQTTTASPVTTTSAATQTGINVFGIYEAYQEYKNPTTTSVTTTTTTTTTTRISIGIDVSKHQGDITWTSVKQSNVDFAIIRSGYGKFVKQEDPKFRTNIEQAQKLGIPCGTYWYSYAMSVEEAYQEAEACYQVIKNYKFEYPVFFDIEEAKQRDNLSTAEVSMIIEAFCSTLESKGYYVGIYSNASFLNTKVYEHTRNRYQVWVAHYTNKPKPDYNMPYGMWQFTSKGRVNGITEHNGDVDTSYCYRDYPSIIKSHKLNGFK